MSDVIQSLWVGPLTVMEKMCMKSFLQNGHPFHLYIYNPIQGVPPGVVVMDASEILPYTHIGDFQNLANFSDYFRYSLLYQRGGWWVDLDTYCLSPFEFRQNEYVFSSQRTEDGVHDEQNCGIIKAPIRSRLMKYCLERVEEMDVTKTPWSALGPANILKGTRLAGLTHFIQRSEVFCPLHYFEAPKNIIAQSTWDTIFPANTVAVHLWNEEWRRAKFDKNVTYPNSLYERLRELANE